MSMVGVNSKNHSGDMAMRRPSEDGASSYSVAVVVFASNAVSTLACTSMRSLSVALGTTVQLELHFLWKLVPEPRENR